MGGCLSSVRTKTDPVIISSIPQATNRWIINKTQLFNPLTHPVDSVSLLSENQVEKVEHQRTSLMTMEQKICPEMNLSVSHSLLTDSDSKENCYLDLPVRKTNSIHQPKKLLSCVPLSGITRSLSLPRRSHSPQKNSDKDDKAPTSDLSSRWIAPNLVDQWVDDLDARYLPNDLATDKDQGSCSFRQGEGEKLSCMSDTTSTVTMLTDDALTTNTFCDPILAELEAHLPAPPPPPRACPPWLKLALQEKCSVKHPTSLKLTVPGLDYTMSSLPSPMPQSFSTLSSPMQEGLDAQKSLSLENNRFSVRIYPVLQNGIKISDTHYWLLDPPRPKNTTHIGGLGRRSTERCRVPPPSPSSFSDLDQVYLNVDATGLCPTNEKPLKDIKLRRGRSEICRDSIKNFYRQLVQRLMKEVPMATEYECEAVLIGSSYNYDQAVKRLKLELLCRNGYISQPLGKRLLLKHNWDLDQAICQAHREHEKKKAKSKRGQSEISQPSLLDPTGTSPSDCPEYQEPYNFPRSFTSSESSISPQSVHGLPESPTWLPKSPIVVEDLTLPTAQTPLAPPHRDQN